MLTKKQLSTLKKLLIQQKNELTNFNNENDMMTNNSLRDATDELSTVDNHPADLATELFEREKDMAIKVHTDDKISQVMAALERLANDTYGNCITCHEQIPYDRLCAIPYTQFCIDHSETKPVPTDRPIEEEIILPPVDNSFSGREQNDSLQDDEDSFRVVAQYGNSDTPADFEGDFDDYNSLYAHDDTYSELDVLHVSQEESLNGQISQAYADEARKHDYLE